MDKKTVLSMVDHTLLKPEATWQDIKGLCNEGVANKTASVCINPIFVKKAVEHLQGQLPVCTVIGFPLGANTTIEKVQELRQALLDGADEFDMVISIGTLKEGNLDEVGKEIRALKREIPNNILKVIVETALLTLAEKTAVCQVVKESGADFIKTSTGFSTGGATFDDVALFKSIMGDTCGIKAAGGIGSVADMEKFIQLGATRLGTSSAIKLYENQQGDGY